jgi:hypothetical protein
MYMCRLRYINDPVFLSLKMEGICLLFNFVFNPNVGHFVLSIYVSRGGVGYFYFDVGWD